MDEVIEMMHRRNFRELIQIHKFVRDQRNTKKISNIEFVNGGNIEAVNSKDGIRGISSNYIFGVDLADN
ncbi:hypothetical protein [Paenibacillus sp. ISL-20]|uniref:hypothetical protein n=1 Tax=Paenibacillus sp. ISL-20 TaxID=2819163 RepID=UPI001BE59899|nr:hypothetical protein [Paenibacillus sp. ISL-20]